MLLWAQVHSFDHHCAYLRPDSVDEKFMMKGDALFENWFYGFWAIDHGFRVIIASGMNADLIIQTFFYVLDSVDGV